MIRNEKGFVLPFTLIVVTIVLFFFLNQVNLLLLEKRYYHEVEGTMTLEYMMETTIYRIKKDVHEGMTGERDLVIHFAEGTAEATISAETNEEPYRFRVRIVCITNNKHKYPVEFTYDSELDSISNWKE